MDRRPVNDNISQCEEVQDSWMMKRNTKPLLPRKDLPEYEPLPDSEPDSDPDSEPDSDPDSEPDWLSTSSYSRAILSKCF